MNYVTNLTISQITHHACYAHIKHLYVKSITKETNLGKYLFIFWDCIKNHLHFCELRYPMCIICIRRGTNIAIKANVRAITNLYNKPYKNFTRSCLQRKNKWKHKFVNNVTVNYVTTILLKSKYFSKCIH